MTIQNLLERHEGKRPKPYSDSVGKLTIGIGRNLTDVGLSEDEIYYLLENDIRRATQAVGNYPWFEELSQPRKDAILDLMFNLGAKRFATFENFIAAMDRGDYPQAVAELKRSLWWQQVGMRGPEIANLIEHETYPL